MKALTTLTLLCVLAQQCMAGTAGEWGSDLKYQDLTLRPKIEARYADGTRTACLIETSVYSMSVDLKSDSGQKVSAFSLQRGKSSISALGTKGMYLEMVDATGKVYSSLNSKPASRINIYRRGPYYIETHWLDVQLTDKDGNAAPIKGEVVFYSYPEKVHVAAILHVVGDVSIRDARFVIDTGKNSPLSSDSLTALLDNETQRVFALKSGNAVPSFAVVVPSGHLPDRAELTGPTKAKSYSQYVYSASKHEGAVSHWTKDQKHSTYFELVPLVSKDWANGLLSEVFPLPSYNIPAKSGRSRGYDPIRGCYTVQTDDGGSFNYHYYDAPNEYETATLSVTNGDLPRKIYVLHETGKNPGIVECGVVLDKDGNTLPITVQISKNFDGEKEEKFYNPGDTPFSETVFPLHLKPGEKREFTSLHLYQNWGNHPLKQFSSLGAWMDYYHMSTGVTETTCYVPFNFGGPGGVTIADFRPMSQRMWKIQPQHDNVAGHSFLRYQTEDGKWHYIEYVGTTFRSTGPNWADMSMHYLSDDGKAKVSIDVFEMPQIDELRNFIHMRVDFLGDIKIKDADFARNVRLLNVATWVQGLKYKTVACGGPTGDPVVKNIEFNDDFSAAGESIPANNGFAAIYPEPRGANCYVIRDFTGKIGGQAVLPGMSVIGNKDENTIFMLVPRTEAKQINAGDFIETNLFLMPYGGGRQDYKPAQKAAYDYGVNAPRVTSVAKGKKLADFPSRIALDSKGKAEFAIAGGLDCIPVIVEGAKDYKSLRIYSIDNGQKTLIEHSQKDQKDGYQVFTRKDGTYGFVFLVKSDGKEHKYLVE